MNDRTLHTLIAALRFWQLHEGQHPSPLVDVASNDGEVDPLSSEEIDDLIENYLNADGASVDDTELSAAARLIHLANSEEAFNKLQVNVAAQITMKKLRSSYSIWYNLDGVSDLICTAIADIHHQGRAKRVEVKNALSSASTVQGKVKALCKVGMSVDGVRCATLKDALAKAAGG